MPLSDLHAKFDASSKSRAPNCAGAMDPQPYTPDGDFVELLWENGQVVMQGGGQYTRPNTTTARKTSLATMFPSISAKLQEKGSARDEPSQRLTRFGGTADHLVSGGNSDAVFPQSAPSTQMGGPGGGGGGGGFGAQDEDLVPWVNCHFDDYYSELLGDFHGVNVVSSPLAHNNSGGSLVPAAATADRGADVGFSMTVVRNPPEVEHPQQQAPPKHPAGGFLADTTGRIRTTAQFAQPPPAASTQQQWPNPIESGRFKAPVELGSTGNSATTTQAPGCALPGTKPNRQSLAPTTTKPPLPPQPPSSSSGIVNFSHFSRPSVLLKATNVHAADRLQSHDKASTAATTISNPMESTLMESSSGLKSITNPHLAVASGKGQLKPAPQTVQELRSVNRLEHVNWNDAPGNNINNNNVVFNGTTAHKDTAKRPSSDPLNGKMAVAPERKEPEKPPDTVIASSSVCSGIGAGVSSNNDSRSRAKRKIQEGEESGYQSDDLEDESVGVKKPPASRVKRSRAAEVHNLSERRRRDRINEKMRALQELIPNCNKVDKASMLDEAIEYLKTLQLQIQIMSMSNGMCMPPMVLPTGMQQLRQPHLAHMPHLGLGMGMGMGMGMGFGMGMVDTSGSPFMPVAPMQGPQFPCPMMTATPGLQMFGMPTPGIPIRMPCGPAFPALAAQPSTAVGGSIMPEVALPAASTSAMQSLDMVPGCFDAAAGHNLNSDSGGNRQGSGDSEIPLTTQTTTECGDQSASVQIVNQTSNSEDPNSSSGNGNSSTGTSYG